MTENLKHNVTVKLNDGTCLACNYITNYPLEEDSHNQTTVTRMLTTDNRRFDTKFDNIFTIEYVTTIEEMVEARINNLVVDGFYFPSEQETPDDYDEENAPEYVVDCSDGRHIEGYM